MTGRISADETSRHPVAQLQQEPTAPHPVTTPADYSRVTRLVQSHPTYTHIPSLGRIWDPRRSLNPNHARCLTLAETINAVP